MGSINEYTHTNMRLWLPRIDHFSLSTLFHNLCSPHPWPYSTVLWNIHILLGKNSLGKKCKFNLKGRGRKREINEINIVRDWVVGQISKGYYEWWLNPYLEPDRRAKDRERKSVKKQDTKNKE